jgi:hypothetical protein
MASIEAVERRRANRTARSSTEHARRMAREEHQGKVAKRMTTRFFRDMPPHPRLTLSYLYWQGRRCGWDFLASWVAVDAVGLPCDPAEGVWWQHWRRLHPKVRDHLVKLSQFRLIRRR